MMTDWLPFPPTLQCIPSHVYLIGISATHAACPPEYWALLSEAEKERALRFKLPHHQQRFALFRSCLRLVLARFINISPAEIEFDYGLHGKPYIKSDASIQFNISHSGDEAVIAVTTQHVIGVDIEKIKPIDVDMIAQRFFSGAEADYLTRINDAEAKLQNFFKLWALKEAYIKATGEGISQQLNQFTVELAPVKLQHSAAFDAAKWSLHLFDWKAGFTTGFATAQNITAIEKFIFI